MMIFRRLILFTALLSWTVFSAHAATPVVGIAGGSAHICTLSTFGDVECWGNNDDQDGSVEPPQGLQKAVMIASGASFSCALLKDKTVECWGSNSDGQLDVPAGLGPVRSISLGRKYSCAVLEDGTVRCWGKNSAGQLDVPKDLGSVIRLSAGHGTTCAIQMDGMGRCWGDRPAPADLGKVKSIDPKGTQHSCALLENDKVRCWGTSSYGQQDVPADLGPVRDLTVSPYHTCALTLSGEVRCWGIGSSGQTNPPQTAKNLTSLGETHGAFSCGIKANGRSVCWGEMIPRPPEDLGPVKKIRGNTAYFCAIDSSDRVLCWGDRWEGSMQMPGDLGQVRDISVGAFHACAITLNDQLRCWGGNDFGQTDVPADLGPVADVSVNLWSTCAVSRAGRGVCWGDDLSFEIPSDFGFLTKITAGANAACVVNSSGKILCQPSPTTKYTFTPPTSGGPFSRLEVDDWDYRCTLSTASELMCFGEDQYPYFPLPADLGTVRDFAVGRFQACAVLNSPSNQLRCWTTNKNSWGFAKPIRDNVLSVAAGIDQGCAILEDHSVKCWGLLWHPGMD